MGTLDSQCSSVHSRWFRKIKAFDQRKTKHTAWSRRKCRLHAGSSRRKHRSVQHLKTPPAILKGHSTVGGGILRGLGTKTLLCDVMPYDACCQFPGVEVRQEVKQISVVEAFHVISCSANVIKSIKKMPTNNSGIQFREQTKCSILDLFLWAQRNIVGWLLTPGNEICTHFVSRTMWA